LLTALQFLEQPYSELFSVIGTTYGAGDGSTTFNLPNLSQRFLRGGAADGGTGGSDSHSNTDPSSFHSHTGRTSSNDGSTRVQAGCLLNCVDGGSHSHGISSSGTSHEHLIQENKPPYLNLNMIIRAQ